MFSIWKKKNQVLDKLSYPFETLNILIIMRRIEQDEWICRTRSLCAYRFSRNTNEKNSCEHLFNQLMLQRVMISSGGGDSKVTKISTKASVFKCTTRVHAHSWPFGSTECSWLKNMFLNSSVHSNVRLILAWPVHARVIQQCTTVFNCSSRYQLLIRKGETNSP